MNWFSGLLVGAVIFAGGLVSAAPALSVEYFYAPDGTLTGRNVNGEMQNFVYDQRGQLLAVVDYRGLPLEQYKYDPAGNLLEKCVRGKKTTYTYDRANQLVSSTSDGKTINYEYDAAGRLVKEGNKRYTYRYLDKVVQVTEDEMTTGSYTYHVDGQLASASANGRTEEFLWDGLALIHRGDTAYLNEPAITGGNPVVAGSKVLFNDMLGTTLGVDDQGRRSALAVTSFGETDDAEAFFTGKPQVDGLGYAFLFRNYRPEQGKWQTADPLGYPDGWNNLVYCNNIANTMLDPYGTETITVPDTVDTSLMVFEAWGAKYTSGKKIQQYSIVIDYFASGNSIGANSTLEQTGANWTDNTFVYVSSAEITVRQLLATPSITYQVENNITYKIISQDYFVRVLTTVTRTGKVPVTTSMSRGYTKNLVVKVKE